MRTPSRLPRLTILGIATSTAALALVSVPSQAHDAETDNRVAASRVPAAPAKNLAAQRVVDGFDVVGRHGLFARGMNAAPAIYRHYVYIGNRTDGSEGHRRPGVQVVDVADPSNPRVVGAIGRPHEANPGETSPQLGVWPQHNFLN